MEALLQNEDTIAAVATGMGGAGIGIIRISGPDAVELGNKLFVNPRGKNLLTTNSHELVYGRIVDPATKKDIDEVLVSKMLTPHSYTAEDVVEINCHGGIVPMRKILKLVIACGARLAEPGEFTKRAFLNGRLDLTQAEAVIDIINAKTEKSLEYSVAQLEGRLSHKLEELDNILVEILSHMEVNIDYPEYDIEEISYDFVNSQILELLNKIKDILTVAETGKIYREGITTAILGEPNVGKSSLLNTLLMENKAIVTDIPGTTRDTIEEYLNIEGIPFKIIDTAGIRETDNLVEKIGVEKSKALLNQTNLVIFMRDISKEMSAGEKELIELLKNRKTIYIANKTDVISGMDVEIPEPWIPMSLLEDQGIETLRQKMIEMVFEGTVSQEADYLITNTRHIQLLETTKTSLENAINTMASQMPLELVSIDVMEALEALRGITGKAIGMDIIDQIFKNFCIGK
ncbi:tRNA uridine-5-carboxymethylaminomethyl(34) synthesis GTPase MnmE [Acetobacterium wieringae]|uniref:tRNA uridine-5-carboxymethylaminomethyl(34) synthesis GTPase MnmE n=1 Tax=Acetobacterium wieringae TaxID=52694 RepID=UPI0026EB92E7|nr:tRNA uridine-5-carboxymethylaminomethyl(34) synthesis GTPase MnmE [Acetobacterium wieringae]